jgi:membrane-associated phospholipid phosphatase
VQIKHHHLTIVLFIVYIIGMTALMIWQGIGIAPDRYAAILLLGALLVRRTRAFLLDWIPFLFILISYDFLRGFADNVTLRVHYQELIDAEVWLFQGQIPTIWLQELLFVPGRISWYDFLATISYFLHFALPLGFGFLLWLDSRSRFRQFVLGIVLLSYAAWITYLAYPAAPPWLAANEGYLPEVHKIIQSTLEIFPEKLHLPTIYHQFNPNPVAAMPSMHAAYPMMVFLFAVSFFGLKALIFIPYVLFIWFSIVYLGEHYVVDIIGGAIYAVAFFLLTKYIYLLASKIRRKPKDSIQL